MKAATRFGESAAGWVAAPWVRWVWRIGGSLLAVAVLGMGTLQVVVGLSHEKETVVMTYDDPDIRTLEVDSENGAVRVTGYDGTTIRITATINDGLTDTRHSAQVEGDRLVLRSSCPHLLSSFCSVSYVVALPRQLDVDISTESGRVTVLGLDGDLEVATGHSEIEVDDATGAVALRSDTGSIVGTNLLAATTTASSSHGNVDLGFVASPSAVDVRSFSGSVEVVLPDDDAVYHVDASSGTGDLQTVVRTDPASDRTVTARSEHGNVVIRY